MYIHRITFIISRALIFNLFLVATAFCNHKIIFLISPPRSLSVAFLRMIETRKDFAIFHEPFIRPFDEIYYADLTKEWFAEKKSKTADCIKQEIIQASENENVFVKEMSFSLKPFLLGDKEFVSSPDIFFVFLVRNPHHTVISFYNKIQSIPDNFSYLIGYQACFELFEYVKNNGANKPLILHTEDLYNDPQLTVQRFCEEIKIPFIPESLEWDNLGENFTGKENWHESKKIHLTQHWHGDAIRSTGFGKPHEYELDDQGMPTFSEVLNEQHRDICRAVYLENKNYYDLLLKN